MPSKEQEYTSPFAVNNQLYFCGVPFRLDSYNGCSHMCKYCFVRSQEVSAASRKNRGEQILIAKPSDLNRIMNIALDTTLQREDINIEWLRHRAPIHWGGMSDPFQPCERKHKISLGWLRRLAWYNYPTVISTKGTMLEEPEYLALAKEGNFAVGVSLITDDDEIIENLEPGAPNATARLKMLETLANNGIWTSVRIQPLIPGTAIEGNLPNFLKRLSEIGVKHITAEAYKVPTKAKNNVDMIWKVFPDAVQEYQYNDVRFEGFEMVLPTRRKWKYVKILKKECHKYGITYGAADNDLRDMGDVVCCCGIDNLPGFENFWRYQASQAAQIAKEKGYVTLEDMQQYWHGEKGFSVHNDKIRISHKAEFGNIQASPKYTIDYFWERGGPNSPESIASMKKGVRNGKLVYEWRDVSEELDSQQIEQATMF